MIASKPTAVKMSISPPVWIRVEMIRCPGAAIVGETPPEMPREENSTRPPLGWPAATAITSGFRDSADMVSAAGPLFPAANRTTIPAWTTWWTAIEIGSFGSKGAAPPPQLFVSTRMLYWSWLLRTQSNEERIVTRQPRSEEGRVGKEGRFRGWTE